MSHWDFGRPSADEYDAARPGGDPDWDEEQDDDLGPYPLTFEREPAPALPWQREPATNDTDRFEGDRFETDRFETDRFEAPFSASAFGAAPFAADPFATAPFAAERGAEDSPAPPLFPADPAPDAAGSDGAGSDGAGSDGAGSDGFGPSGPSSAEAEWQDWAEHYGGGRRRRGPAGGSGAGPGGRRWLVPASLAVAAAALGAGAVLLTSGHPGPASGQGLASRPATPGTPGSGHSPASASASGGTGAGTATGTSTVPASMSSAGTGSGTGTAALTLTEAKAVLAGYTTANNQANAERSDTLLATIETGSSYAIDAALYKAGQAAGTAPYPAFVPVSATYYLPRNEPSAGPRWFVVQVANAFSTSPAKVVSTEYVLFTQPVPGGAWLNTIEPYEMSGASAPPVTVGADGLATAVSPGTGADAVAPGQLPAATAAALDGTSTGPGAVADPGNLADEGDARQWRKDVAGAQVAASHASAPSPDGQEFALLTNDGGALVFYTDAARLTVTPPAGSLLHVTIPGFYSPSQALTSASVTYLEQFAAYDPPAGGGGAPRIVADYSAVTGTN